MPYQVPERIAPLTFTSGPLEGLTLSVRTSVSIGVRFRLLELIEKSEEPESLRELLTYFADQALVSWDLVDRDGQPVPCSGAALIDHFDLTSAVTMLRAYLGGIGKVAAPLAKRSGAGRTSKARRASSNPPS